jgi:nucleoside phosphorylase
MLYIIVALKAEANKIIKILDLKRSDNKIFTIYESSDIKLIISGVGSINSAIATTYLLTKHNAKKDDTVLNIGMCGSSQKSHIEELFNIHKVIDLTTNQVFHLRKNKDSQPITTSPKAITDKNSIKTSLVDMESSGFYLSCSKFIKKDNIIIKKIVSDNLDDDIKKEDFIDLLFEKHMKSIYEECISYGG